MRWFAVAAIVSLSREPINDFRLCGGLAHAEVQLSVCFFTGWRPKLGAMTSEAIAKALPFSVLPGDGLAADKRRAARHLYWQGWKVTTIAAYIEEPRSTVQGWKDAEEWDKAQPVDRVEAVIETRMAQLVMRRQRKRVHTV